MIEMNADDLTLRELDVAQRLMETRGVGKTVAMVYVYLKRADPAVTLESVSQLRSGDISVTSDADQSQPEKELVPLVTHSRKPTLGDSPERLTRRHDA